MNKTGFSLIELMITVAIIGILSSVAYPNYVDSIQKSRRADAQGALMDFAAMMARYQSQNLTYAGAASGGADTGSPTIFSTQAPVHSNKKTYNLTIQAATASSYTLRASPISTGPQNGDGYLELLSTGERRWDKNNNSAISSTESTWK